MMNKRLEWTFMTSKPRSRHLFLGVGSWVIFSSAISVQSSQAPGIAPRCNLAELNAAYDILLTHERRLIAFQAPGVRFDKGLLKGTVLHNQLLESKDTLFHALGPYAELAGTFLDDDPHDPPKVARLIFERLKSSPPHRLIQYNPELVWVSISATDSYYVIRLSRSPSPESAPKHWRHQSDN